MPNIWYHKHVARDKGLPKSGAMDSPRREQPTRKKEVIPLDIHPVGVGWYVEDPDIPGAPKLFATDLEALEWYGDDDD